MSFSRISATSLSLSASLSLALSCIHHSLSHTLSCIHHSLSLTLTLSFSYITLSHSHSLMHHWLSFFPSLIHLTLSLSYSLSNNITLFLISFRHHSLFLSPSFFLTLPPFLTLASIFNFFTLSLASFHSYFLTPSLTIPLSGSSSPTTLSQLSNLVAQNKTARPIGEYRRWEPGRFEGVYLPLDAKTRLTYHRLTKLMLLGQS